jgi:hypothetical protein
MAKTGLLDSIILSVESIDLGRKGLATDGKEHEGRIAFTKGLNGSLASFAEAQSDLDLEIMIQLERAFLTEELRHCGPEEPQAIASVTQAISYFDDALRSLESVLNPEAYRGAEKTYLHNLKYRTHGMPRDAFHLACMAHRTRITNTLRTPGINPTERKLFELRAACMTSAQNAYLEKQKQALGIR